MPLQTARVRVRVRFRVALRLGLDMLGRRHERSHIDEGMGIGAGKHVQHV